MPIGGTPAIGSLVHGILEVYAIEIGGNIEIHTGCRFRALLLLTHEDWLTRVYSRTRHTIRLFIILIASQGVINALIS